MGLDFICLGAQKAGTTWLYHELKKHPQCQMPKIKELRFFDPYPCKNLNKYLKNFQSDLVSGDMTPEYSMGENTPKQIYELFPNIKLFMILRNPIDRAFSNYRMSLYLGSMSDKVPFIKHFRKNHRFIATKGYYVKQIKNYMNYFELHNNLKVFFYDDLLEDPIKYFYSICDFLKIERLHSCEINKWNESHYKDDGLIISNKDEKEVASFYKDSNDELYELLKNKWILTWK